MLLATPRDASLYAKKSSRSPWRPVVLDFMAWLRAARASTHSPPRRPPPSASRNSRLRDAARVATAAPRLYCRSASSRLSGHDRLNAYTEMIVADDADARFMQQCDAPLIASRDLPLIIESFDAGLPLAWLGLLMRHFRLIRRLPGSFRLGVIFPRRGPRIWLLSGDIV